MRILATQQKQFENLFSVSKNGLIKYNEVKKAANAVHEDNSLAKSPFAAKSMTKL